MASIHSIYYYPIKGCRAVKIAASDVTTGGLVGDRQWVLVNQDGIVNQKKLPTLRFLDIALEQDRMTLSLKGAGSVQADFADSEMSGDVVSIGRQVACEHAAEPVNRWLSQAFGQPLSLVRAVEASPLQLAGTPFSALHDTSQSAFVDIAPLLIVSLESLADLNGRLSNEGKRTVAIEQFRPNVVIEGVDAFAEESAKRLEIGALGLTQLLPCERCSVTTFNVSPESESEGKPSKEPLKTLSQYRNGGIGYAGGVTFGAYFAPESDGKLQVGGEIKVIA